MTIEFLKELIDLYLQIGEYISSKCENSGWGKNISKNLADYLIETNSDLKGCICTKSLENEAVLRVL